MSVVRDANRSGTDAVAVVDAVAPLICAYDKYVQSGGKEGRSRDDLLGERLSAAERKELLAGMDNVDVCRISLRQRC